MKQHLDNVDFKGCVEWEYRGVRRDIFDPEAEFKYREVVVAGSEIGRGCFSSMFAFWVVYGDMSNLAYAHNGHRCGRVLFGTAQERFVVQSGDQPFHDYGFSPTPFSLRL